MLREYMKWKYEKGRQYANHFEGKNKKVTEIGVVHTLYGDCMGIVDYRASFGSDPPDCKVTMPDGEIVGVEVVEVVDNDACRINDRHRRRSLADGLTYAEMHSTPGLVYRDYSVDEIVGEIWRHISEKNEKIYKNRVKVGDAWDYKKIVLLIYSDEPSLNISLLEEALTVGNFEAGAEIDEVYMLLSYDPRLAREPYLRIA